MGNNTGGNSATSHFVRTYTTFSGVDITALFDNLMIMTMQGIAISITREKVPIYVFGRSRPVSISPRQIFRLLSSILIFFYCYKTLYFMH
jgi:hypothetical protein